MKQTIAAFAVSLAVAATAPAQSIAPHPRR